jgi:hypothetical protein
MMRIFPFDIDGPFVRGYLTADLQRRGWRASHLSGTSSELSRNRSFPSMHTPLACVAGHVSHPSDGILLDRCTKNGGKAKCHGVRRRSASSKGKVYASRPSTRMLGVDGCVYVSLVIMSVTVLSK